MYVEMDNNEYFQYLAAAFPGKSAKALADIMKFAFGPIPAINDHGADKEHCLETYSKEDEYVDNEIKFEGDSSKSPSIEPSALSPSNQYPTNNKPNEVLNLAPVHTEIISSLLLSPKQNLTKNKPNEALNLGLVNNEIMFSQLSPHRNSMAAIPPHQPYGNLNFSQHRLDPGAGDFYPQPHLPYSALDHAPQIFTSHTSSISPFPIKITWIPIKTDNDWELDQSKTFNGEIPQRLRLVRPISLSQGPEGRWITATEDLRVCHTASQSCMMQSVCSWNLLNPGKCQYEDKCLKAHVKWTCWELMRNSICNDATTSHRQMHEHVQDMDYRRFLFESIHGHAANPRFPETQQIPQLKAHECLLHEIQVVKQLYREIFDLNIHHFPTPFVAILQRRPSQQTKF
ncbi:uncharacterized protein EAE97_001180 [Botrytis byssoidea]|uniref:C3H1-type domain-containing protein n=1 Tax=Botrytis byssoidea TaxID=139641 RepID=A0A9P5LYW8_9HELO|nr:uncharacterized protein EAE97_001180 [Botrytis byssoidea]KAF7953781.1 hypothetical protein EAE97_001180 [Botrytis byssoidea]